MDRLQTELDRIFEQLPKGKDWEEWKEEMTAHFAEKMADACAAGQTEETALEEMLPDIEALCGLYQKEREVGLCTFFVRLFWQVVMAALVFLLFSVPLFLLGQRLGVLFGIGLLLFGLGGALLSALVLPGGKKKTVSLRRAKQLRKRVWVGYGLFLVLSWALIGAIQFGNHVFFGYPVAIDGMYQLGRVLAPYYGVALGCLLPLAVASFVRAVERGEMEG